MPNLLTNVNIFSNPVVAPASGDAVSSTGLANALQPLTNRTYYLLKQLGADIGDPDPRNAANGFAGLDSAGKVALAQIHNGIVAFGCQSTSGSPDSAIVGTSGSTFVEAANPQLTLNGAAGDVALIVASLTCDTTVEGEYALSVTDGVTTTDLQKIRQTTAGTTDTRSIVLVGKYTLTALSVTAKLRVRSLSGTSQILEQAAVLGLLIRP